MGFLRMIVTGDPASPADKKRADELEAVAATASRMHREAAARGDDDAAGRHLTEAAFANEGARLRRDWGSSKGPDRRRWS